MSLFIMEYRVIGYSLAHAFSRDPKAGKRTFTATSEDLGTTDIQTVVQASNSPENTPERYELFKVRNRDTGEEVKI